MENLKQKSLGLLGLGYMTDSSLYAANFSTWLGQQVLALKHRDGDALDGDNVAAFSDP